MSEHLSQIFKYKPKLFEEKIFFFFNSSDSSI